MMKWMDYNSKGKLTWFGLPLWVETSFTIALGIFVSLVIIVGCSGGATDSKPEEVVVSGKYRVVQIYGTHKFGTYFKAYSTDDVHYDGPWVKFYDKEGRRWVRVSGSILVEGGD